MWTTTLYDQGPAFLQWGIAIGAALTGAVCDTVRHRIPNGLTGPVWVAGLAWAAWNSGGAGLADAVAASVLLAAPYVLLFAFASGGAGDAKLMGALGAWLGLVSGLAALLGVALAGVAIALAVAVFQRRLRQVLSDVVSAAKWPLVLLSTGVGLRGWRNTAPPHRAARRRMPYGPAIFAGVCAAALGVGLWRSW